jgi:tetratricopeptide (TPR) repeat protein
LTTPAHILDTLSQFAGALITDYGPAKETDSMRTGTPRALILLALISLAAPLTLGGCMSKAKKHLYAAEDLFEKRDLAGAKAELEEAVKEDPDLLDAHKSLAHIDEALGDEDGAAEEYDAASRLDPTDSKTLAKARYYHQLKETENSVDEAIGDIKAGKSDEGLSTLRDAIKETRSNAVRDQAIKGLAKAAPLVAQQADDLLAHKDYAGAIKGYDGAVRAYMLIAQATNASSLDPNAGPMLHSANAAAKASGSPDAAFKLLNDVLTADPDNKAANIELAQVYLAHTPPDYSTAADLMERAGAPDADVAALRAKAKHQH